MEQSVFEHSAWHKFAIEAHPDSTPHTLRFSMKFGIAIILALLISPVSFAQPVTQPTTAPAGLPEGRTWGGGAFRPKATNVLFASGDGCALCHSTSDNATALWSQTGEDVSPHGLWQGTMMANAARDPYFRAQLAHESAKNPKIAANLEALCMRCHTPMAHHTYRIANQMLPTISEAASHPLYSDGVSCTVCHQIQPDGLGTDATWDGQPVIKPGRTIFGPFADPGGQPMIMHSAFTPKQGSHIQSAALCGSCHTLRTEHTMGGKFTEQSPYLEWRNSAYSDENGRTGQSRTCQECHMPDVGPMRIARNPGGFEFNIKTREPVRGHAFIGGNALMLDILKDNATELGVTAPLEALERIARATRTQLGHRTATIAVEKAKREKQLDGKEILTFDVVVTNLTGHKFPTGYPARRAWVSTLVRAGRTPLFSSGSPDDSGKIENFENEVGTPHVNVVTKETEVPIYEMVAADANGKPTLFLSEMATRLKDNRLLPAGYKADGPHVDVTAPVGTQGDDNFTAGSDRISYRIPIPADASGRVTVIARLYYQTIPPTWAGSLRGSEVPESMKFLRMYDAAKSKVEQIAVTVGSVE